ncbi:UNVERIFIED_CONTAM: hypothetical protein HDU68_011508 [Siphonaria sp. JEL0065]|nr:hypothetical protein HDU68_011508 [Siphonaria sp. JEL0065]
MSPTPVISSRKSPYSHPKGPQDFKLATRCVVVSNPSDPFNATYVPIYQTATFKQTSATDMGFYDYTRSGNPTRSVLETTWKS